MRFNNIIPFKKLKYGLSKGSSFLLHNPQLIRSALQFGLYQNVPSAMMFLRDAVNAADRSRQSLPPDVPLD